MAVMPVVYTEKCSGCGLCVSVCYCGALSLVDKVIVVLETEECGWCTECEAVCQSGAIVCPFEILLET